MSGITDELRYDPHACVLLLAVGCGVFAIGHSTVGSCIMGLGPACFLVFQRFVLARGRQLEPEVRQRWWPVWITVMICGVLAMFISTVVRHGF